MKFNNNEPLKLKKIKVSTSTIVILSLPSKDDRIQNNLKSKISNSLSLSLQLNSKQYFQSRKKGRQVDALAHEDDEGRK